MRIIVLGMAVMLIVCGTVTAQPQYGEKLPTIVSSEWLAANLQMKDLRIVDMRDSIGAYGQGHIPGAVYLHPETLLWPERGIPGKLMPVKNLASLLGSLGIDHHTYVVVYGETGDSRAAYLAWVLEYLNHSYFGILDGGFGKWQDEQRSVTQGYPDIKPKSYGVSLFRINRSVRADEGQVKYATRSERTVILDVRRSEIFTGEEGDGRRRGHIKGARNHFWQDDLNTDGTWKPAGELRSVYEDLGITADTRVIVYCDRGHMAAHTYSTLKHVLGYQRIRLYDGGFQEWAGRDDLPTGVILIK